MKASRNPFVKRNFNQILEGAIRATQHQPKPIAMEEAAAQAAQAQCAGVWRHPYKNLSYKKISGTDLEQTDSDEFLIRLQNKETGLIFRDSKYFFNMSNSFTKIAEFKYGASNHDNGPYVWDYKNPDASAPRREEVVGFKILYKNSDGWAVRLTTLKHNPHKHKLVLGGKGSLKFDKQMYTWDLGRDTEEFLDYWTLRGTRGQINNKNITISTPKRSRPGSLSEHALESIKAYNYISSAFNASNRATASKKAKKSDPVDLSSESEEIEEENEEENESESESSSDIEIVSEKIDKICTYCRLKESNVYYQCERTLKSARFHNDVCVSCKDHLVNSNPSKDGSFKCPNCKLPVVRIMHVDWEQK